MGLGLTSQASCPYCACLPQSEKQQRADDSALSIYGSPCRSPLAPVLPAKEKEFDNDPLGVCPGNCGHPLSVMTNLLTIGALLIELLVIIKMAADCKKLTMLPPQVSALP